MINKKGRKYDREKWGWKSEDEVDEHCHYSGLPSPAAYEDKHPYYDSDKKIRNDKFASKVVLVCIVGVIILTLVNLFMVMCRLNG